LVVNFDIVVPLAVEIDEEVEKLELLPVVAAVSESDSVLEASG
jgi:hypothetical protein